LWIYNIIFLHLANRRLDDETIYCIQFRGALEPWSIIITTRVWGGSKGNGPGVKPEAQLKPKKDSAPIAPLMAWPNLSQ